MKIALLILVIATFSVSAHRIRFEQSGYCSDDCKWSEVDDGSCDPACFVKACDWDGDDCPSWWPKEDEEEEQEQEEQDPTWVDNTGSSCYSGWVGDGICDPPCAVESEKDGGDCDNLPSGCTVAMIGDKNCDAECYAQSTYYDWGDCPDGPPEEEDPTWVDNTGSQCYDSWVGDGICDPSCAVKEEKDGGDCDNLPSGCTLAMIGDKNCDADCYEQSTYYDWGDCPNGPPIDYDSWENNTGSQCHSSWVGDDICDPPCAVEDERDGGDCDELPAGCEVKMIGNRVCDNVCNTQKTYYDWGDC